MIRSSKQLRDKIRQIAVDETGVRKAEKTQALLRIFMMERFLERISVSQYKDRFILKGGMLVAAYTGVESRTTKDIDTSIRMLSIKMDDIRKTIEEIAAIDIHDGIRFEFIGVEPIMQEHDYPGVRFSMDAFFEKTRQHFSIDVSTDDVITPEAIMFSYPLMFEQRTITLLAYNLETMLSEKLETIMARGTANTRLRDFYDIFMLTELRKQEIDYKNLRAAFEATTRKRGTTAMIPSLQRILNQILESDEMRSLWEKFSSTYSYAKDIAWDDVIHSVSALADCLTDNTPENRDSELPGAAKV